jgi:uncharacterized repeat protein (TIGR03803 family)
MPDRSGRQGVIARAACVFAGLVLPAGCAAPSLAPPVSPGVASTAGIERSGAAQAAARSVKRGYTLLYSFAGSPDGAVPYGGLIAGGSGELLGTTYFGGTANPPSSGAGTVFALKKTGGKYVESVLHSFGFDGYYPATAPTLDPSGVIYATVQSGPGSDAAGGVVSLSPSSDGYSESGAFHFSPSQGSAPQTQLVELPDGSADLNYGTQLFTTTAAGASGAGALGWLTLSLSYTGAYSFQGGSGDGAAPMGNLVIDPSRKIDGATSAGGAGDGTVFQYDTITGKESVLYAFEGGANDGSTPVGGVALDNQGNIYGTTKSGGADGAGVVFKLSYNGSRYTETVLHSFGGKADGATPLAAPVITVKSNILYGTTSAGGANGAGTIYQIATDGAKYKVLYSFTKATGATPGYGSLLLQGNTLYGTTQAGGTANLGVAYSFVP